MNYQNKPLPDGAEFAVVTPEFTEKTVPQAILQKHMAPRGKCGLLRVREGKLQFQWEDTGEVFDADPDHAVVIYPERFHHVIVSTPVKFVIEFYRLPQAEYPTTPAQDAVRPGEQFLKDSAGGHRILTRQEVIAGLQFRHACKMFDPDKVIPDEDFACILEAARLSPSSFGLEPWHFLIIQDKKLRAELAKICWGGARQMPSCSHLVLALTKKSYFMRWDRDYIQHMLHDIQKLPAEIIELYNVHIRAFEEHDFELMESERALCDWATHQTYIPLANMMMAAAYLGIDSCPMEGFVKREIDQFFADRKIIDPEQYTVAYAVAFGYRQKEPRPKTRQALSDITTFI